MPTARTRVRHDCCFPISPICLPVLFTKTSVIFSTILVGEKRSRNLYERFLWFALFLGNQSTHIFTRTTLSLHPPSDWNLVVSSTNASLPLSERGSLSQRGGRLYSLWRGFLPIQFELISKTLAFCIRVNIDCWLLFRIFCIPWQFLIRVWRLLPKFNWKPYWFLLWFRVCLVILAPTLAIQDVCVGCTTRG